MDKAIEKINAEMQKDPKNLYLEIVGQYIIGRCTEPAVSAAVESGKTLDGAIKAITDAARAKQKNGCAAMRDTDIFDAVDKYLGAGRNDVARARSRQEVENGSGAEPAEVPQDTSTAKILNLSFEDLL